MRPELDPPGWILLSWLALPGAVWLALSFSRRISETLSEAVTIACVILIAGHLTITHFTGRLTGSFHVAQLASSACFGVAGTLAYTLRAGRLVLPRPTRGEWQAAGGLLVVVGAFAPVAFQFWMHDELLAAGHLSMVSQLAHGTYPPRHTIFPEFPLVYHHGFGILAATVALIARIPVPAAIDAVTVALVTLAFGLAFCVGERVLGVGTGLVSATLTVAAGRLPVPCGFDAPLPLRLTWDCPVEDLNLNPSMASYCFQHPFAVGLCLSTCSILVASLPSSRSRTAVLVLVLVALPIGHLAFFPVVGGAVVLSELYRAWLDRARHGTGFVFLAAVLVFDFAVTPLGRPDGSMGFDFRAGIERTLGGSIVWNLWSLSLLLPLGAIGLIKWRPAGQPERLLLALIGFGGLAVANLVRYRHSWDIVKLAAVGASALCFPAALAVSRAWQTKAVARAFALLSVGLLVSGGFGFLGFHIFRLPGIDQLSREAGPIELEPDDVMAVAWLRKLEAPEQLIWREGPAGLGYAQRGISVPFLESGSIDQWGFPEARVESREALTRSIPEEIESYRREGIRFVAFDDRLASTIRRRAQTWVHEGRAREAARFGSLSIVELGPRGKN
ncbi:MAG: hypothetical protein HYV07_21845 [Deltaproteobacteria bacterium]|nr:hypothetical protein [Deltaproteobacteria bacterium]